MIQQGFSQPVKDYEEKLLDVGMKVRYLYESGRLEGYQYGGERRKRFWSIQTHSLYDVENSNMWNAWKKCSEEVEENTSALKDGEKWENIYVFLIVMMKRPISTQEKAQIPIKRE